MTEVEKEKRRQYYAKNRNRIREQRRLAYIANPAKYIAAAKAGYFKNVEKYRLKSRERATVGYQTPERKEYLRKYANENREKVKVWKAKNRENSREKRREWQRKDRVINRAKYRNKEQHKAKTDPLFRIVRSLRARTRDAVKGKNKSQATLELVGATMDELKVYLESQFKDGMSWNNYGKTGWHIDHIIPCSSFDLTDLGQQKLCFNWINLQPLWWWENLAKGNKLVA